MTDADAEEQAAARARREEEEIRRVIERLSGRHAGNRTTEEVARTVREIHLSFDRRPIRDFVPVLVERLAEARLALPVRNEQSPGGHTSLPL